MVQEEKDSDRGINELDEIIKKEKKKERNMIIMRWLLKSFIDFGKNVRFTLNASDSLREVS